jgi:drug/metabolite transporter (DMT)-like permease
MAGLATIQNTARDHLHGILWMLAAGFGFAVMDATGKFLTGDYHVVQISWARYLFHILFVLPIFWTGKTPGLALLKSRRPWQQLLRSLMLLGATVFYFLSVTYIPLAEAAAIGFVAPLIVTALSVPLLKEKVGWRRWAAVSLGLAAALAIVRPGFGDFHWAMALPLLVAVFFALYQIITRILGPVDDWRTTLFYSALVGLAAMSVGAPFVWVWPSLFDWCVMAFLGFSGAVSHLVMIRAFQCAPASLLAPFSYVQMVWATALGLLIFGDFPDEVTLGGAVLIVAAGLYVWHREHIGKIE